MSKLERRYAQLIRLYPAHAPREEILALVGAERVLGSGWPVGEGQVLLVLAALAVAWSFLDPPRCPTSSLCTAPPTSA
jgi:hypothetical protein